MAVKNKSALFFLLIFQKNAKM